MPEISYNIVAKKPGTFPPDPLPTVILFAGSDDGLKREAVKRVNQVALDESFADFDHETIDLSLGSQGDDMADPVARIIEAAAAAPFSSPKRVVTVLSLQKLSKERQEALALLLPRLSPLSLLILIADAPEMEAGKPKGKQIENSLRKAAVKSGVVLVCDSPDGADLRARAATLIAEAGKSAAHGVIEALTAACVIHGHVGADVNLLTHETNKLLSYVGESQQITKADVAAVITGGTEENIFRLLDCVGMRDTGRALFELDALLAAENKPDGTVARLIVMLQRHFRFLTMAKYLAEHKLLGKNQLPEEVTVLLPGDMASFASTQGYRMAAYAKQAANFRWDELLGCFERIVASDLSMKGIFPGKQTMKDFVDFGDDTVSNVKMLIFDLCYRGK
jgi:DNA polymerase III subunit delta